MESFDVAIIGAGPAGTSSALFSSRLGLRAAVFEEHGKVGEPVHCGECFSEASRKRLGLELPDEAISLRVDGIRVVFPNRKTSFIREQGYSLEKEKFEQHIARLGQEAGATYKMRHRVSSLSRGAGGEGWQIATTQGEYFAKLIIDASGVDGVSSRLLSLNPAPRKVVGLQYEMSPVESDGFIDFFLWPALAPHGYLWVIPKKGGRANVGLVTNDPPSTRKYLEKFIDEYGLREKGVAKSFGGMIPASGPQPKTYADGILLAGDAAGFTSPMFEGGTSLALTSGKFAAQAASEALLRNDTSPSMLSKYETMWRAEFPDYQKLVGGKEKIYGFTDSELGRIAGIIPRDLTKISALQKAKIGASVLLTAPNLLSKGFVPAMEALGNSRAEKYGW